MKTSSEDTFSCNRKNNQYSTFFASLLQMSESRNSLEEYNSELHEQILTTTQRIEEARLAYGYTSTQSYLFTQLTTAIQSHIDRFLATNYPDRERLPCLIHWIDKAMYGADLTIKFDTSLVRALGKSFASEFVPQIVTTLHTEKETLHITDIEQKGIYINATLTPRFWTQLGDQILTIGDRYGDVDLYARQTAIAEYSSPNAAKHLHAGHVRSTVIWHVLANIYDHAGYTVHRINHINDRGWLGQLIEGWKRWHDLLQKKWFQDNNLNYEIYSIWRTAEKISYEIRLLMNTEYVTNEIKSRSRSQEKQRYKVLEWYFNLKNEESFLWDYLSFLETSIANFHALEAGHPDMFTIRKEIVASSLVEFNQFYDKLDISHDYTIGESFYEKIGRACIKDGEKKWIIVKFTEEKATTYREQFLHTHPDSEETVRQKKHEEILADIWSYVVLLDNRERFVVLRSDGGSIYATRDIGCLWFRTQTRAPSLIMYEVGQEQADHFQKLFETADKLGWLDKKDGTKTHCLHIAHGFYVDAASKKKLSSRAGAANVHNLIDATIEYFKDKYAWTTEFTPEEIDHNARTLGIASIIINDLSKNRMDPVLVDPDLQKTIQWFEQSGGAYLIYTVCRAKSLLRKATVDRKMPFSDMFITDRPTAQITLLQKLSDLPSTLTKAVAENEPSVLVHYGYQLTQLFNTLYSTTSLIVQDPVALRLTACYIDVMSNVLRLCNIEPLERI